MTDTHKRFEIDLDEIERQLRRSVDMPAPPAEPKGDPLSELARIVGQNDPFAGILGAGPSASGRPGAGTDASPTAGTRIEPSFTSPSPPAPSALTREERDVLGTRPVASRPDDDVFDPVTDAYGSADNAVETDDFQPLPPQRPRRRLAAVMAGLVIAVGGTAGYLAWRNGGPSFNLSGPPPLIKADNAPVKVAPENPGGMEIPNQDRQIYERGAREAASRVLDRQEQPIDVREATRAMPPPPSATPSADMPIGRTPPATVASPAPATTRPSTPQNAVANALGEPKRVRTVAVRPDGSTIFPPGVGSTVDSTAMMIPGDTLPPPVQVPTMSIPMNGGARSQATPASNGDATPPATGTAVAVLPPQRPRSDRAVLVAAPSPDAAAAEAILRPREAGRAEASDPSAAEGATGTVDQGSAVQVRPPARPDRQRSAAASPTTTAIIADDAAPASAASRPYSVQLAVRPTEGEARSSYAQLSEKYASDLNGKPAVIARAEVGGKTVYRVRIAPLARGDANALCTRLKASGGACFVVAN